MQCVGEPFFVISVIFSVTIRLCASFFFVSICSFRARGDGKSALKQNVICQFSALFQWSSWWQRFWRIFCAQSLSPVVPFAWWKDPNFPASWLQPKSEFFEQMSHFSLYQACDYDHISLISWAYWLPLLAILALAISSPILADQMHDTE